MPDILNFGWLTAGVAATWSTPCLCICLCPNQWPAAIEGKIPRLHCEVTSTDIWNNFVIWRFQPKYGTIGSIVIHATLSTQTRQRIAARGCHRSLSILAEAPRGAMRPKGENRTYISKSVMSSGQLLHCKKPKNRNRNGKMKGNHATGNRLVMPSWRVGDSFWQVADGRPPT